MSKAIRLLDSAMIIVRDALLPAARTVARANVEKAYDIQVRDLMRYAGISREEAEQRIRRPDTSNMALQTDAEFHLDMTIRQRLVGAIACYEARQQLECVRYVLLALGAVFTLLKQEEATQYLSSQTTELHRRRAA